VNAPLEKTPNMHERDTEPPDPIKAAFARIEQKLDRLETVLPAVEALTAAVKSAFTAEMEVPILRRRVADLETIVAEHERILRGA
jgi:hypothetical protein